MSLKSVFLLSHLTVLLISCYYFPVSISLFSQKALAVLSRLKLFADMFLSAIFDLQRLDTWFTEALLSFRMEEISHWEWKKLCSLFDPVLLSELEEGIFAQLPCNAKN